MPAPRFAAGRGKLCGTEGPGVLQGTASPHLSVTPIMSELIFQHRISQNIILLNCQTRKLSVKFSFVEMNRTAGHHWFHPTVTFYCSLLSPFLPGASSSRYSQAAVPSSV